MKVTATVLFIMKGFVNQGHKYKKYKNTNTKSRSTYY
jgi:hypothetical protein